MTHLYDEQIELLLNEADQIRLHANTDERLYAICDTLVQAGVYPNVSQIGYSPFRMVQAWGARWHEFAPPHNCLHCGGDLRDHAKGPPFKREIGQTGLPGGTQFYCPDCTQPLTERTNQASRYRTSNVTI